MSWPVWVRACHNLETLGNTERKFPYPRVQITAIAVLDHMKSTETSTTDGHYNQITLCVLTQHTTALRNFCGSVVRCNRLQNESSLSQTQ
jgi:hypothetical protein